MALSLLLYPLLFFKYIRIFPLIILWLWIVFCIVDLFVFRLYRFHLNPLIIEMVVFDYKGIGVPLPLVIIFSIFLGGLFLALLRLSKGFLSKHRIILFAYRLCAFIFFVLAGLNVIIHIWANEYSREEVTCYDFYPPVYYPVTSHSMAPKIAKLLPSIFPPEMGAQRVLISDSGQTISYPLEKLVFSEHNQHDKKSILFIVVESWQADSFNFDIMPNLSRRAAQFSVFKHHISSGSTTVPGLFGLLYGVHPTFYLYAKNEPYTYSSIFTKNLYKSGYTTRVFTPSNLRRFQLNTLFFSNVAQGDYYYTKDDEEAVEAYLQSLGKEQSKKPRFDFVFLTSTHSPYVYPDNFQKFGPVPAVSGGFVLNKSTDGTPYKNKYHNSVYYTDHVIERILAGLEQSGGFSDTWVVITGDHAEQFNENKLGYWGHGSNFTKWQTHVPLLIKKPAQVIGNEYSYLSTHQDIVPTLMEDVLFCASPASFYSNGINIFSEKLNHMRRGTIVMSYNDTGYLFDDSVIEKNKLRKYSWKEMIDLGGTLTSDDLNLIRTLFKEENIFVKPKERSKPNDSAAQK